MSSKELRRRLHAVDPHLTIVPGGRKYRRKKAAERDWERAAGEICSKCGQEYWRGREGLCYRCWEQEHEYEIRDKLGVLNFFPQSILEQITHKANNSEAG